LFVFASRICWQMFDAEPPSRNGLRGLCDGQ
jgi:hypothetical protein